MSDGKDGISVCMIGFEDVLIEVPLYSLKRRRDLGKADLTRSWAGRRAEICLRPQHVARNLQYKYEYPDYDSRGDPWCTSGVVMVHLLGSMVILI